MRATLGFTQVWRARKPPPCALRLPATLVGHATDIKPPPFPTFVYASTGSSLFFSVSLFFLLALARVALTLRSLRLDTPRLCRFAVPVFQYKYKPTFSRSKLSHRHLSSHGYNKHLEGVLRALSWAQQTRWITVTVKWEHSWRHSTGTEGEKEKKDIHHPRAARASCSICAAHGALPRGGHVSKPIGSFAQSSEPAGCPADDAVRRALGK